MSNLLPRNPSGNTPSAPDGFSRTEGKALQSATNREIARGIIINTQLSVARFVTLTAMNDTAMLAKQAYALADGDEYLGNRLGLLVDGYVTYARGQIDDLRRLG